MWAGLSIAGALTGTSAHAPARPLGVLAQVVVQKSAATLYAATIDNKLAMKVGSADWSPADGNVQASLLPTTCLASDWPCAAGEALMCTPAVCTHVRRH